MAASLDRRVRVSETCAISVPTCPGKRISGRGDDSLGGRAGAWGALAEAVQLREPHLSAREHHLAVSGQFARPS
jgi:hypothetical protein